MKLKTGKILGITLRYLVTTGLLIMVYRETGIWTTVFALLLFLRAELQHTLYCVLTETLAWLSSATLQMAQRLQEGSDENNKED